MYYRSCGGNMQGNAMAQGNQWPMMQNGMCPMMQNQYNQMMQNYNMPMENNMAMKMEDNSANQKQLEMLYPEIYFVIFPHVKHHCDKMEEKHGKTHCPSKEDLKEMIEDVCKEIEKVMDKGEKSNNQCREDERRPRPYGNGRLLRDLVGIMFINELIGRRPPYYGSGYGYWY